MTARAFIAAAVLAFAGGCARRVDRANVKPETLIAGGNVMGTTVRPFVGTPVQVALTFKDGSPQCMMLGEVTLARDSVHRWVWLEATEGCPDWLAGRWYAELASGGSGWYLQNISTEPITN